MSKRKDYYQSRRCPVSTCLKKTLQDVTEMADPTCTIVRCDTCGWKGKLKDAAPADR
jgi:hypothetical protein